MNLQHARKKKIAELKRRTKQGFDWHQGCQSETLLDQWPAQEFFRCINDITPVSYVELWENAGGKLLEGGRMIALKNDPIWTRISRFGLPYPPFDEYDVMEVRDIDRDQAVHYGLISLAAIVEPQIRVWDEDEKCICSLARPH